MKVMLVEDLKDIKDPSRTSKKAEAQVKISELYPNEHIEYVSQWEGGLDGSILSRMSRTISTIEECDLIVFLKGWHACRYSRFIEQLASFNNVKICRYFDL